MNVKHLTTRVATAALVGAIGLAYAQSPSSPVMPASNDSSVQQPAPAATPPAANTNMPSNTGSAPSESGTTSPSSTTAPVPSDGTMQAPAPRVDRG
jgi:hypothetical protein